MTNMCQVSGKDGYFPQTIRILEHSYLIFSVIAGLIGGAFSVYMRMELQEPGVQYMTNADGSPDGHLWNVVITAHGLTWCFLWLCLP